MTTWNHRVIHTLHDSGEESYAVHEVYYAEDGHIEGWTKLAVNPYGETLEELRHDVDRFLEATARPVLEFHEIDEEAARRRAELLANPPEPEPAELHELVFVSTDVGDLIQRKVDAGEAESRDAYLEALIRRDAES